MVRVNCHSYHFLKKQILQNNLKKIEGKKTGFYKKKIPDFRRRKNEFQKEKKKSFVAAEIRTLAR